MARLIAALLATAACLAPADGFARNRAGAPQAPAPQAAPVTPDPLIVVVSLKRQRLSVFNKAGQIVESPISSGQAEFPTPTGVFSVIGKEIEHESNIYEGAAMPYMQRLTWSGTAMHAGNLPGYPASHGCIRLPYGFSQKLFGLTAINTRVIVTRDDVAPQPISHANLFVPLTPQPPSGEQMVSAVTSKVASIAGVTPAMAAPVTGNNQLPLTEKAKARLAETARLFDAIKPTEAARNAVWERVKSANRDLEAAKSDINSLNSVIADAERDAGKARKVKQAAEGQLAAIMRKAENARSPETIDALGKAEDAAEARLLELADKLDAVNDAVAQLKTGMPMLKEKLQTAETARRALDDDLKRSNQALKDAISNHGVAKREFARYMKPVSVLVSRKDQRLYVRQGFDPVLEVPVVIDHADQPLGTHVFTAMGIKDNGAALNWTVVSLNTPTKSEENRRNKTGTETRASSASKALDRIQFPAEALAAIADVIKPGSSLIVSDESTSQYFGNGTDFTVAVR